MMAAAAPSRQHVSKQSAQCCVPQRFQLDNETDVIAYEFTKTFTKRRAAATSSLVVAASARMTSKPCRRTQSTQACSTQSTRSTRFTGTHSMVRLTPVSRISNSRRVHLYAANGQPATAGATHARSTTKSLSARFPTPKKKRRGNDRLGACRRICCTQPIHTTGRRTTHCMLGQSGAGRRRATEQRHGRRNSQPVRSGWRYWKARGTGRGPRWTARPQGCRHARIFRGDEASATQSLQQHPARPRRRRDWPRLR